MRYFFGQIDYIIKHKKVIRGDAKDAIYKV